MLFAHVHYWYNTAAKGLICTADVWYLCEYLRIITVMIFD